jgi:hypothetical protein
MRENNEKASGYLLKRKRFPAYSKITWDYPVRPMPLAAFPIQKSFSIQAYKNLQKPTGAV